MSQLRPVGGGGLSGSTTPLRRLAPELNSGRRANSESLLRRCRATVNGELGVDTSDDEEGSSTRFGSTGGWTAEADEGLRFGVPAPDLGSAGVEGGG